MKLTTEVIVGAATPPESPLHRFFEWDDTKAAHKFRKRQAGHLLRFIEVVRPDGSKPLSREYSVAKSNFAHAPKQSGRPFITTTQAREAGTPDRQRMKQKALQEARDWRDKYRALGFMEFSPIFDAIDDCGK